MGTARVFNPEEGCGNNRSVMPLDVPGCTRATMIVAESIYYWFVAVKRDHVVAHFGLLSSTLYLLVHTCNLPRKYGRQSIPSDNLPRTNIVFKLPFRGLVCDTCSINSWSGQTIANCWSRSQLGMHCTGLWFNKPPGIRPCPLYTPPVALTDGLFCEFEGPSGRFFPFGGNLNEQCGLKEREVVTRHR